MVFPFQTDMAKPPPSKPRKRKNPGPPASVASDDDTGTAAEETQQADGADTEEGRPGPVHRLDPRQWLSSKYL